MAFHNYPYTDLNELNLDWLIQKMKDLESRIDGLHDELKAELTAELTVYVNNRLAVTEAKFEVLKADVEHELGVIEDNFDLLRGQFRDLDQAMNDYIDYINGRIADIQAEITADIAGVNARTDALIASNNEYLLSQMETYLSRIKVINYFTGEQVSIQDMFNYLAGLHLTDAIDYDTMALRAKTYTEFANMNMTYTNLAMHGNTLYVQEE